MMQKLHSSTKKNQHKLSHLIYIGIILLFYALNHVTPLLNDDLLYQFVCITDKEAFDYSRHIETWGDIIDSQLVHYKTMNGRSIVHIIVQFFCGITGKTFYNIIATFMFAIWIPLFGKMCFPHISIKKNLHLAILATFIFWLISEETTVFYSQGIAFGMNYLYPSMMCMLYTYLFCYRGKQNIVLLSLIGFITGWSHEIFSVATGAYIFFWMIPRIRHLKTSQYVSFFMFCLGAAFLVFAPGNFVRVKAYGGTDLTGLLYKWAENYSLLIFIGVMIMLLIYRKRQIQLFIKTEYALLISWFVSCLFVSVIFGSRYIGGRQIIGIYFIGVMIFFRFIYLMDWHKIKESIQLSASVLYLALLLVTFFYQIKAGEGFRSLYKECIETTKKKIFYGFPTLSIPSWMEKYIYYRHDYIFNHYYDKLYSSIFHKDVYVYDEEAITCYKKKNKVKGDNPFYQTKEYLYSREPLPAKILLETTVGKYQHWDLFSVLKRLYFVVHPSYNKLRESFCDVDVVYTKDMGLIYRVRLSIKSSARKIESISVK